MGDRRSNSSASLNIVLGIGAILYGAIRLYTELDETGNDALVFRMLRIGFIAYGAYLIYRGLQLRKREQ